MREFIEFWHRSSVDKCPELLRRAYDPNSGRWLSRDPAGEASGINVYGYVENDPLNRIDSEGLESAGIREAASDAWQAGLINSIIAYREAKQSQKDAANSGLGGVHNGPADAYRHCLWSCRMARSIGAENAKIIGENHEIAGNGEGQPANEFAMDTQNNRNGRAAAKDTSVCCEKKCMQYLKLGRLAGLGGQQTKF